MWEVGQTLGASILPSIEALPPWYGYIYIITSGPPPTTKQYEMTIGNFPTYICNDFTTMMACSLGGHGKWVHCKHLYYILQSVMYCD